jgi:hypothetical protein
MLPFTGALAARPFSRAALASSAAPPSPEAALATSATPSSAATSRVLVVVYFAPLTWHLVVLSERGQDSKIIVIYTLIAIDAANCIDDNPEMLETIPRLRKPEM